MSLISRLKNNKKKRIEEKARLEKERLAKERSLKTKGKLINKVIKLTGWTVEYTEKQMDEALELHNIPNKKYVEYELFFFEPDEQLEIYNACFAEENALIDDCVKAICEAKGNTPKQARRELVRAREKLHIPYRYYVDYKLYDSDFDVQKREYRIRRGEEYIQKTMQASGWDRETAIAKMEESRALVHCKYLEYAAYNFYKLSLEEQQEYFTDYYSGILMRKFDTDPRIVGFIRNKDKSCKFFSKYFNRKWCITDEISEADFVELFKDESRIIYKPIIGGAGKSVQAIDITPETIVDVYNELKRFPHGLAEEYVVQHPEMSRMNASSVNTIRIVTISSRSKPVTAEGKHIDLAYAVLRMGWGDSVIDNMSAGGFAAVVDLETGRLCTDGTDRDGNKCIKHPTSGTVIKGFEIPFFKEAVAMVLEACDNDYVEGYFGWDVAIREDGPVLIEVNNNPGAEALQAPFAMYGIGKLDLMRKYMD